MDNVNSITLVDKLCESFFSSESIPATNETLKKLKKQVISQLFNPAHRRDTTEDDMKEPCSQLKTDILCQAVKNGPSEANGFAYADKMYNMVEQILQEGDPDIHQNIFAFLHELCELNESKEKSKKRKICKIPINKNNRLYSEIISYEDIDWSAFHKDTSPVTNPCLDYPFYEEPGEGISFFKQHIADFKLPSGNSNNICDMSYKIWRFDLNKQVDAVVHDEGFVTPGSEFSGGNSVNDEEESQCSDKCSDLDLSGYNLNVPLKCSWDRLGNNDYFHELPFSSESIDSIIHFWKISNSSQNTGVKCLPIGVQVTFTELINDLRYLLFGVASQSFYLNEETKLFEMCDRLHTATLSPEMLAAACKDLLRCANYFYSLKTFAEERLQMTFGSIHHTFCKCVQQVLNMYRYCLLKMEWQNIKYLTNFHTLILPLYRKLTFLAKFCMISIDERNTGLRFPSGIQLLDYLYSNLFKVYGTDVGYMMFYMFETCCNTYLRIVSEWIFDGCFSNPANYAEFFIEIRREYEICRDWRRVSCIGIRDKKVPKFLDKFYKEIFVCGKSINLLKICSSKEILDNLIEKDHPNLMCCFNQRLMTDYEQKWRQYKISFEEHFNGSIKIRDKLLRKYDNPDFYAQVKRSREDWFREQDEMNKSIASIETNSILNEENPAEDKDVQSKTISDNNPKITEVEQDSEKEQTTEENPSDQTSKSTEPKAQVIIGFASGDSEKASESNLDISLNENCSTPNPITQGAGDCVENNENKRVKHLVSLLEQKSKSDKPTPTKSPKPLNLGGGDTACTPSTSKVLKEIGNVSVQSEYAKNKLRASTSFINSPVENVAKKFDKTPLSACQENKLKVMSSEYHNRLNESLNTPRDMPKTKPTVLTACQENKLKVMSSEYHARLNDSLSPPVVPRKPAVLSALQENKLRVMSSEYHNRLSTTIEEPVKLVKGKLSICDENKLKVMSSEYHIRLNESLDDSQQKPVKNEPEKPLSALQENKLKVMSSEYHYRLSTSGAVDETPKREKPLSACEQNKLKVMSSEYHVRLQDSSKQDEHGDTKPEPKVLTECEKNKLKVMSSEYHCRMNEASEAAIAASKFHDNLSKITEESDSNINQSHETPDAKDLVEKNVIFEDLEVPAHRNLFDDRLENFTLQSIETVDISSIADVDTTSLEYYLAQSIAVPLKMQMKLVNEAILRVFIEEECYLDHLTSLRDYLLLRKPEFTVSLCNSIFKLVEKVKKPYLLLNNYTLSSILQRALLATGSKDTITFGKKLSFVAEDDMPEAFTLVDIKELDCLGLNYSIKWPINILITEPIMKKYCKIFKFLLQIQRVMWVLKRDFISLKNLKLGKSIQYMKIQLFRHNMTQVVKILQEYVMREALETCWNNFVDHLTNAEIDLDVLYMSHLKYINKTMQRCFLCDLSSPCRESILNLFSVILKYHEALKAGVWRRNVEVNFLYHTNFQNIDGIYVEFVKKLNQVRADLRGLVYGKQKTYYESLYLELSKNAEVEV